MLRNESHRKELDERVSGIHRRCGIYSEADKTWLWSDGYKPSEGRCKARDLKGRLGIKVKWMLVRSHQGMQGAIAVTSSLSAIWFCCWIETTPPRVTWRTTAWLLKSMAGISFMADGFETWGPNAWTPDPVGDISPSSHQHRTTHPHSSSFLQLWRRAPIFSSPDLCGQHQTHHLLFGWRVNWFLWKLRSLEFC